MAKEEVTQQSGITTEQLMQFARELKAPSAEEQEEQAKKKARKAASVTRWKEDRVKEEAQREHLKLYCESGAGHIKSNGKTALSGQIMSDGFYRAICQRCHSVWKFKPTAHLQGGGELRDYASITSEQLAKWEKESLVNA